LRTAPLVLAVAFSVLAAGCGTVGLPSEGADQARGKALFVESCGSCHRLADAGTTGAIGPDLDAAFAGARSEGFRESTIRSVVRGQIAYPTVQPGGIIESPEGGPPQRAPGMPANLVTGDDADAVATYVAAVAGVVEAGAETGATTTQELPPAPPPPETMPTETQTETEGGDLVAQGKDVFTKAGCGSCHILADAGSTGTIGPDLDEAKPSEELAVERVTNGKPPMPAFKGQLSAAEIEAVAAYVATVAGR
jgi:mono/diheme cytochrome c family protein